MLPLIVPAFTFQSSKILWLTATASTLDLRMGACEWQRGMEIGEPGRKGQSKFFIPWFPLPSPRARNPLKSFGSFDKWSWRTDYHSLAYLSVPLSSLLHYHCTLLARLSSFWQGLPALPATFEKRQESARHTSFFHLLNTTPQGEELNANQITLWMKTSWWLMFSVEFQGWAKLVLRLWFFDYLLICLSNLNAG